jgi:hypothetical protein
VGPRNEFDVRNFAAAPSGFITITASLREAPQTISRGNAQNKKSSAPPCAPNAIAAKEMFRPARDSPPRQGDDKFFFETNEDERSTSAAAKRHRHNCIAPLRCLSIV